MTSKCWYMSHNPKNGVKKEITHIVSHLNDFVRVFLPKYGLQSGYGL